jgi:hypothetical protein
MRKLLALPFIVASLACCTGTASAAVANFKVTIKGSFATGGSATQSGCYTYDADGNTVPLPDKSGKVTETDTFASARSHLIQVGHIRGEPIGAGRLHKTMPLRVTTTRTSDMIGGGDIPGCRPADFDIPAQPTCGTKTHTYQADISGSNRDQSLVYVFIRQRSYIYQPGDPFSNCGMVDGEPWFGDADSPRAKVSVKRLFNRHVRKVVLHAKASKSGKNWSYSEKYTLTLVRVKGTTLG